MRFGSKTSYRSVNKDPADGVVFLDLVPGMLPLAAEAIPYGSDGTEQNLEQMLGKLFLQGVFLSLW